MSTISNSPKFIFYQIILWAFFVPKNKYYVNRKVGKYYEKFKRKQRN